MAPALSALTAITLFRTAIDGRGIAVPSFVGLALGKIMLIYLFRFESLSYFFETFGQNNTNIFCSDFFAPFSEYFFWVFPASLGIFSPLACWRRLGLGSTRVEIRTTRMSKIVQVRVANRLFAILG